MFLSDSEIEFQFHDDEVTPFTRKQHRNNDTSTKLEATEWARAKNLMDQNRKCFKQDWGFID